MNKVIRKIFTQISSENSSEAKWRKMFQLGLIIERNYRGHFPDHNLLLSPEQLVVQLTLQEISEIVDTIFGKIYNTKDEVIIGNWLRVLKKVPPHIAFAHLQKFFITQYSTMSDDLVVHIMNVLGNCLVYDEIETFNSIKSAIKFEKLTLVYGILTGSEDFRVECEARRSLATLNLFMSPYISSNYDDISVRLTIVFTNCHQEFILLDTFAQFEKFWIKLTQNLDFQILPKLYGFTTNKKDVAEQLLNEMLQLRKQISSVKEIDELESSHFIPNIEKAINLLKQSLNDWDQHVEYLSCS